MVSASNVARHFSELHSKVEEVAERAGVPACERQDLRTALAALPWRDRRRLGILFESVRAHADGPDLQEAIRLVFGIAGDVWAKEPPPSDRPSS